MNKLKNKSINRHGVWLSFDLLLTFLLLFSLLSSVLPILHLSSAYSQARSDYAQRLSMGLALSQRFYEEATPSMRNSFKITSSASNMPGSPSNSLLSFSLPGYFDAGNLKQPLSSGWQALVSEPSPASPSHICVMREMIGGPSIVRLWVCDRG